VHNFIKSLSAGERFSAIVIATAFLSVVIPAAVEFSQATAATHSRTIVEMR
jgi:hypothetical protein